MISTYNNLSLINITNTLLSQNLLVEYDFINPNDTIVFNDISVNSNQISEYKANIFIAYQGENTNGHDYILDAIKNGAKLVIYEDKNFLSTIKNFKVNSILVKSSRKAWSYLEALKYDNPHTKGITFIGVTGTNGKTSTTWFIKEILNRLGYSVLFISTVGVWLGDEFLSSSHTTPDPPIFYHLLYQTYLKKIKFCVMEVSSHALSQYKLCPISYDASGFISFSRDHLDYHKSMDNYLNAKLTLFTDLTKNNARCVFYQDLPFEKFPHFEFQDIWIYGSNSYNPLINANFVQIQNNTQSIDGSQFTLSYNQHDLRIKSNLMGKYTIENLVAAYILVEKFLDNSMPHILSQNFKSPPGRLEYMNNYIDNLSSDAPKVFVDYAHTPDALNKVLDILRSLCKGQLWVVFGCGGDRDHGKRSLMGNIAYKVADKVVITSDNPRNEEPIAIINDILKGIPYRDDKVIIEPDRAEAIKLAIHVAHKNDIILIAGKGHENYIEIKKQKIFFDDRAIAQNFLKGKYVL